MHALPWRTHPAIVVIVATSLIPAGFAAITCWPFIFVEPARATDEALIAHELVHYEEQAWITPLWWAAYTISPKFRFRAEVRGYRAQIQRNGITVDEAADMLMKYRLGITKQEALEALTS